jgi:hypothetical protein
MVAATTADDSLLASPNGACPVTAQAARAPSANTTMMGDTACPGDREAASEPSPNTTMVGDTACPVSCPDPLGRLTAWPEPLAEPAVVCQLRPPGFQRDRAAPGVGARYTRPMPPAPSR